MGSFIVTTDSGCDLPLSFCSSRGIIPLKMNYAIGDKNYTDTMDPKDLKSFYDGMRSGDTPKTSQVTPYQFTEFWTPLLEKKQPGSPARGQTQSRQRICSCRKTPARI